jgi:hypothetical protein
LRLTKQKPRTGGQAEPRHHRHRHRPHPIHVGSLDLGQSGSWDRKPRDWPAVSCAAAAIDERNGVGGQARREEEKEPKRSVSSSKDMVTRRQIISSGAAVSTSTRNLFGRSTGRKGGKKSPVKRNPNEEDTLQLYMCILVGFLVEQTDSGRGERNGTNRTQRLGTEMAATRYSPGPRRRRRRPLVAWPMCCQREGHATRRSQCKRRGEKDTASECAALVHKALASTVEDK